MLEVREPPWLTNLFPKEVKERRLGQKEVPERAVQRGSVVGITSCGSLHAVPGVRARHICEPSAQLNVSLTEETSQISGALPGLGMLTSEEFDIKRFKGGWKIQSSNCQKQNMSCLSYFYDFHSEDWWYQGTKGISTFT